MLVILFLLNISFANAVSSIPVESVVIPTSIISELKFDNKLPSILKAKLFLPEDSSPKHSVVIVLSASGGIKKHREIYYANELIKNGIAALVVDSEASRNLSSVPSNQFQITTSDYELDAFVANKFLSKDKRFDSNKIGVMGVSKGGAATHFLAMNIRRKWRRSQDYKFAAYASLSPSCFQFHRNSSTDGKPMLFMIAELDDASSPKDCLELIKNIKAAGNLNIKSKIYIGAHHAWEAIGKVHYHKTSMMFGRCLYTFADDGMIFPYATGIGMSEEEWRGWALKNCIYRGGTDGGGTLELKRKATDDLMAFFIGAGFGGITKVNKTQLQPQACDSSRSTVDEKSLNQCKLK